MNRFSALARNLFRRGRVERDLDEELCAAIELLVQDKMAAGLSEIAARRAAVLELGGAEQVKERVRDVRMGAAVEGVLRDASHALRGLRRTPGFTLVVVGTLAVTIALATIIASTIDTLWHMVPAVRSDRLAFVASTDPRPGQSQAGVSDGVARTGVSIPDLVDFSVRTAAFQEFAGLTFGGETLTTGDVAQRVTTARITTNLLDAWDMPLALGRPFRPEEGRVGGGRVAILSQAFWTRHFSKNPTVLGDTVTLDGVTYTVIGVLPASAGVGIFRRPDIFVPILLDAAQTTRDQRRLFVTGVLKPDVTREQGRVDLERIARELQQEYPDTNAETGVVVLPLIDMLGGNTRVVLWLLGVIATLIVGIAWTNVSNIVFARMTARGHEMAVRAALGAGRLHQVRQLMCESAVASCLAGAAGLVLASWALAAIRLVAGQTEGFSEMSLNGRVLTTGVVLSLLAPFGCALLPALRMTTPEMEELRHGTRVTRTGRRLRAALVTVQIAFTLILMFQVGLIVRTMWTLRNLEKGFDPAQVLTLRVDLASEKYRDVQEVRDFFVRAIERVEALPGVDTAGVTTSLPIADREVTGPFTIEGAPLMERATQPTAARTAISASYLNAMRIPVIRGRGFSETDVVKGLPVALVNDEAAHRYWPQQDPIGKRIAFDSPANTDWYQIVGIVGNIRNSNADAGPVPQIYSPDFWRAGRSMAMVVRTTGPDPTQVASVIRAELAHLDKDQPVYGVASMDRVLFEDLGSTYLLSGMLAVIGLVALVLAGAGVYGVVSYAVSQRTREIGLRMALGARSADVVTMILGRGSIPIVWGLAIGAVASAGLTYLTSASLEEIDLRDPVTYVFVIGPLVGLALLASYVPARRATHIDPMVALRVE